jgi:hypothetical protein
MPAHEYLVAHRWSWPWLLIAVFGILGGVFAILLFISCQKDDDSKQTPAGAVDIVSTRPGLSLGCAANMGCLGSCPHTIPRAPP